jgi:hypothetical protein
LTAQGYWYVLAALWNSLPVSGQVACLTAPDVWQIAASHVDDRFKPLQWMSILQLWNFLSIFDFSSVRLPAHRT